MTMNRFMHPKNPYKTPPDFKDLALAYPEFRKHATQGLTGKVSLNFKDEGAVWALTKCLLKKDFDLDVEMVPSHLVPTLPLRLNYILWISDILNLSKSKIQNVFGIDIGTGSCCIYPLIAAKRFNWNMIGTEVDDDNFKCATENIERNKLNDKIEVRKVTEGVFLCEVLNDEKEYDFCMCNPPFYDESDPHKKSRNERSAPRNAHTGAEIELATEGGEVSFVKSIIDDSIKLKNKIKVYTSMLGHKSSLLPLKKYIRDNSEAKVSSTMFCQGRTSRWGLAWTFLNIDLEKADIQKRIPKKKDEYLRYQDFPAEENIDILENKIFDILDRLEIEKECSMSLDDVEVFFFVASKNTWINSRRKRREEKRKKESEESDVCGKRKLEEGPENERKKSKSDCEDIYLKFSLAIKKIDGVLRLEMILIDGPGGKDGLHQLLQYLKNNVK